MSFLRGMGVRVESVGVMVKSGWYRDSLLRSGWCLDSLDCLGGLLLPYFPCGVLDELYFSR